MMTIATNINRKIAATPAIIAIVVEKDSSLPDLSISDLVVVVEVELVRGSVLDGGEHSGCWLREEMAIY